MTPGVVDMPMPTPARTPKVKKRTRREGAKALDRSPRVLSRDPPMVT